MTAPRHFTVLGAGTVGVCIALTLRREGHRVTLIDRDAPGMGCSFGNAGIIQVGGVVPLATPGILKQVPKMLMDPEGPLVIRWPYLPRLMPYLLRFMASARPAQVESTATALAGILQSAIPAYDELIKAAGAEDLIRRSGELYVYETDAAFAAARPAHDLRRKHGVRIDPIPVEELRRLEPALAPIFRHAVLFSDCISTLDPALFTQRLAAHFEAEGGEMLRGRIDDLEVGAEGPAAVIVDGQRRAVDEVVVALGAYSKRFAAKLGSFVPLDTERGYHLMVKDSGLRLGRPVVFGDQKFGAASMVGGLRLAGTAELCDIDQPPNFPRAFRLMKLARRALPGLSDEPPVPWMGHRPSTPDSLPVICRAPHHRKAYFAFGHGHLGLTMGAVTGRLVADLAAGRPGATDLAPFDIRRFHRILGV